MVHVIDIIRPIGHGSTEPKLALLHDGEEPDHLAVIKMMDNPQGKLVLFNEYVSYHIAKAIGVLMPESGVAKFSSDHVVDVPPGPCFFSSYISKALPLNLGIMGNIANKNCFAKIILLDHLIYNSDRNKGNLLVSYGKPEKLLYAIDHSHVFKNQAIWDADCLRRGIREHDYRDLKILEANGYDYFLESKTITSDELASVSDGIVNTITDAFLSKVLGRVPAEWLPPARDVEALKDYLLYRVDHLADMCEMIEKEKGLK